MIFDPGGGTKVLPRAARNFAVAPLNLVSNVVDLSKHFTVDLLNVMQDSLPQTKDLKSVIMEARISSGANSRYIPKCTLDTGANRGNYIGREALSLSSSLGCSLVDTQPGWAMGKHMSQSTKVLYSEFRFSKRMEVSASRSRRVFCG